MQCLKCEKKAQARGLCSSHYHKHREYLLATGKWEVRKVAKGVKVQCSAHYVTKEGRKGGRCLRPAKAYGLCAFHYLRHWRGIPLNQPRQKKTLTCAVKGCGKKRYARKMCETHYRKQRRAELEGETDANE